MSEKLMPSEVLVEVGFESGASCVFRVSPSGRLSPSLTCSATADEWYQASQELVRLGLREPSKSASASCPSGGTCWPWWEDDPEVLDFIAGQPF